MYKRCGSGLELKVKKGTLHQYINFVLKKILACLTLGYLLYSTHPILIFKACMSL